MRSAWGGTPGFWRTVRLLLAATRKRAAGRRKRQAELLGHRAGKDATDWGALGSAISAAVMIALNLAAAYAVTVAVSSGERFEAERQGKIVVSRRFLDEAKEGARGCRVIGGGTLCVFHDLPNPPLHYSSEAREIAEEYGGKPVDIEQKLRGAVRDHGSRDFIKEADASPGMSDFPKTGQLPAMLGSIVLLGWAIMLVFQGEGLDLDIQRRRHPMWEWQFSHPVSAGAVFLAEMLSPIASNPVYWGAPLFAGFLYGAVYSPELGVLATFLVGIPIAVAAACVGKAVEIGVVLRFPPRSRGAIIGVMSWLGYASMMLLFLGMFAIPKAVTAFGKVFDLFTMLPWPWLRLFLSGQASGSFSFQTGVLTCWIVAGTMIACAVGFSVWGAKQGLSGNFGQTDSAPPISRRGPTRFGKDPLYRKEFLWFARDRSAIVQTILIPLTVASVQMFNLRRWISDASSAWNYLCGAGILFGTYFLWILGPKSLASEGTALWIALTWPRGLESLLKAKAWLWSLISSGIVGLVLAYAIFLFPADTWKIALVGVGWFIFGRSMAEKSVTLVSVASSSGEQEKIPSGRRWAAQLGMLTFAIGVFTQQWHIAVMGIVYSYMTAAAMWQNFRARLPYLYDPWSEQLPPPPTLMHAMIAISILVEGGAVVSGIFLAIAGRENLGVALAFSYGICSVAVSIGMSEYLNNRHVTPRDVWRWPAASLEEGAGERVADEKAAVQKKPPWWLGVGPQSDRFSRRTLASLLLAGAAGGVALGLFARGYHAVLMRIPEMAELFRKAQEQMSAIPDLRISYFVMAVGFAPFAEEYLFRGLLFRALDREWGGWYAVLGSAAFFAVYHPALSWLPVGLLGVANALLFKKTGRLAPAVVLHMVYNAIVLA